MKRGALLAAAALAVSCAHGTEPDITTLASSSDQIIWEAGQKAFEKRAWETARQYFRRIVDGFPNSEYGPSARIALGDSYFREGGTANYILAIAAYREFLTLYPSHPRADHAQFRIAEAFDEQRNGPDRDQTQTERALEEFERLVELYPSSTHLEQARQRIEDCRQSLARAEYLVGYFYQRTRQAWRAAITRYESVLRNYPDYRHTDEVLYRLAECLAKAGRTAEAPPRLSLLLERFPDSDHAEAARQLLNELSRSATPAPPTLPSPPAPPNPAPPSGTR